MDMGVLRMSSQNYLIPCTYCDLLSRVHRDVRRTYRRVPCDGYIAVTDDCEVCFIVSIPTSYCNRCITLNAYILVFLHVGVTTAIVFHFGECT